jgi:hypothetical protein
MTKKWDEMNLTEKSLTYAQMRNKFPDRGVTSTEEAKIMQLCEMNIPAENDAIGAVIRGETSVDKIKLATVPVKTSSETEYNSSADESDSKDWYHFL